MGSFTDFLENEVLDHLFGAATYTAPATIYVGLSTTTIADDGTNITEPSGNGYARVAKTNDLTNWPAASGGAKASGTITTFPVATGSWGTVIDFFLADASSGGNILAYGTLDTPQAIVATNVPFFAVGNIDITLT